MRAANVLILTTELTQDDFHGARGNRLRHRFQIVISLAKQMGLKPIIVIGTMGDDVLRMCPELEDCDFAFDPNYSGNLFSSIQAGLHAAEGAAFVLPIDADVAAPEVWEQLDKTAFALLPNENIHVVKPVTHPNGDTHPVYPQLVSRMGLEPLRKLPVETDWDADGRISVRFAKPTSL